MSYSFIQNCRITASFTASGNNSWTLITSLVLQMLTMLPSLYLISSKQTVFSNQCLCCSTGLKVIVAKTKLQNVGAGDPSSTVLIDHGSHAVLPTIYVVYSSIGITVGVDPGGGEVLTPENM